jgi:hypothetical protein
MTINRKPQDTSVSSLPSKIISSQAAHSYSPVTASPVCQASSPIRAGRETVLPGYDGRMTTSPRTTAPAPAGTPATTTDQRAAAVQRVFAESIKWDDEAMINFDYDQRHLARCLGCRMANINCEC